MGLNQVTIQGNLTRDPQLSYLPSQTPVVDFGLASNRKWKDQNGEGREEVCFVDCQAFGKIAENIAKFFSKGRAILVVGRLKFDQWETPEGDKRSKHKISVEAFHFIDSQKSRGDDDDGPDEAPPPRQASPPRSNRPAASGTKPPPAKAPTRKGYDDFYNQDANQAQDDGDIPF